MLNLGNLYRRQGNFAEAEKLLNRALESQPDDPEVHYSMGMLYARQDKFDQAMAYLEKSVELRPDYPDALNNLGVLLVREKRYEKQKRSSKPASVCSQLRPGLSQSGAPLCDSGNKENAREILQQLLRLQPQHKVAQQAIEMLQ